MFPQGLDAQVVVVVRGSMALTPLVVDLALKVAGPELNREPWSDGDDEEACEVGGCVHV